MRRALRLERGGGRREKLEVGDREGTASHHMGEVVVLSETSEG